MHKAEWHLVRRGQLQIFGSQRLFTGDPFRFLPLFRTHREAEDYCRQSGLWQQGIRPLQSPIVFPVRQAAVDGVRVVGVFVGFSSDRESCWEYFRAAVGSLDGEDTRTHFEVLPEDDLPLP